MKPHIYYIKNTGNLDAFTLPPIGIFINERYRNNKLLLAHELVHWHQYERSGPLFALYYALAQLQYGYDQNPFEIEARAAVGENLWVQQNYTKAVRTGQAKTIFNPFFRK